MNLKFAIGFFLSCAMSSAFAGTFTSLAILSQSSVGSGTGYGTASGIYTSVGSGNFPVPHAYYVLETTSSATADFPEAFYEVSLYHTAVFQIHWKQSTVTEAPPINLYHHHTVSPVLQASYSLADFVSGSAFSTIGPRGAYASPDGFQSYYVDNETASYTYSGGWTVALVSPWVHVATDPLTGLKTYRTNTPSITSDTLETRVSAFNHPSNQTWASGSATDNFFFSASSTP